jgi:hypothetical protein
MREMLQLGNDTKSANIPNMVDLAALKKQFVGDQVKLEHLIGEMDSPDRLFHQCMKLSLSMRDLLQTILLDHLNKK